MRRLKSIFLIVLAFCFAMASAHLRNRTLAQQAQGAQPGVIVIEGGTLIDGNGGVPVRDVQIVIQGNKITKLAK